MKKYFLFNILLILQLLFVLSLIVSCKNGDKIKDNKSNKIEVNKITSLEANTLLFDKDPYFIESKEDTSVHGPTSISRNIIQDKNGDFWFATWEGIIHYDGKTFTNHTNKNNLRRWHVFAVMEDSKGNIWFGTIGAGIYLYDGKKFTNITSQDGLAHDSVTCLYEDNKGSIWIGTQQGASCYDPSISFIPNLNSIKNYTKEDGLANHDINAIAQEESGLFWFGTRGEASNFDGEKFLVIKNKDGSVFTNVRSILKDQKGSMWLGGNDGLWRYQEESFTNYASDFVGYIYEDKKGNILTSSVPRGNRDWSLSQYSFNSLNDPKAQAKLLRKQEGQLFGLIVDADSNIWFGTERGVTSYDGKVFNSFRKPNELKQ